MKKKIIISLLVIAFLFSIIGYFNKHSNVGLNKDMQIDDNNVDNEREADNTMQTITNINVIIGGKEYNALW